jgi:hypothetical protein
MRRLVLLDSGVIGLLLLSRSHAGYIACRSWVERIEAAGVQIQIPHLCYYFYCIARSPWIKLGLDKVFRDVGSNE